MGNLMVSIACFTYNHEDYIRDAIEGFLMQKTNFKFEILIHDDASTDKTAEIIKEYEQKYPELFKPIYQTENQFSQGSEFVILNLNRAKGKYIAFCEGDDYWTDPYKLQNQVDFMEANEGYSLCGHKTKIIDTRNYFVLGYYGESGESREIDFSELMYGHPFHLSSMMYRANLMDAHNQSFVNSAFIGDYAYCLWLGTLGKIYCINEEMSVYRKYVNNSWTSKNTTTLQNQIKIYLKLIKMFQDFDVFTVGNYAELVNEAVIHYTEILQRIEKRLANIPCRFLMINSIDDYNYLKELEEVYIFGTGEYGQKVESYLATISNNVEGFIDNNLDIVGNYLNNKLIYSVKDIDKNANILICSSWYKEIFDQLKSLNFKNIFIMNQID